jgi:hypothetical protein
VIGSLADGCIFQPVAGGETSPVTGPATAAAAEGQAPPEAAAAVLSNSTHVFVPDDHNPILCGVPGCRLARAAKVHHVSTPDWLPRALGSMRSADKVAELERDLLDAQRENERLRIENEQLKEAVAAYRDCVGGIVGGIAEAFGAPTTGAGS